MRTTTIRDIREYTDHNLYSPSRAEIDLDQLKSNLAAIKQRCGSHVKLMAVVKADAYGHGAERIARAAIRSGADCLAVAHLSEGVALRAAGIQSMILILGVLPKDCIPALFEYQLTPSIISLNEAILIHDYGKSIGQICTAHIRIDVGNRSLGLPREQCIELIQEISQMTNIHMEGIYTHLTSAYADDLTIANMDIAEFNSVLLQLQKLGIFIPTVHASSSPAILTLPDAHYTMVRCGIIMYGLPAIHHQPPMEIKPIMQIKSTIVGYKHIEPGHFFGYANKFVTDKHTRIAIVPFGYADGSFMIHLQHGEVLIRGVRAAIIGQIYMDHFLVDVSELQTEVGDEVVIVGEQGNESIAAVDMAERASVGRLNSDFVCLLSQRVPRVYMEERVE